MTAASLGVGSGPGVPAATGRQAARKGPSPQVPEGHHPTSPRFQTPGPQNDETVGGPSRGQPEGTDAGDPSRPLPGPGGLQGTWHTSGPACWFLLTSHGESGGPTALRTREPSGSSGTCDLGDGSSQSRSWSGYSFAHWAPAAQQTRGFRRCWGSDWSPELVGTRCSWYRSSRLAPGDGSKAAARPAEPTALPLRGLAGARLPPMGGAFPSPVLGLGLLGPSWAGSPLRSPLPSSVRGQATPARFQKRAPARVPALR